jgi:hypothetical protein
MAATRHTNIERLPKLTSGVARIRKVPARPSVTYFVTYGANRRSMKCLPLEAALEHAGQLVSDHYANVAIQDGKGIAISGDDLLACYLGVMKLTPDLRATQVPPPS